MPTLYCEYNRFFITCPFDEDRETYIYLVFKNPPHEKGIALWGSNKTYRTMQRALTAAKKELVNLNVDNY